MLAPAPSKMVHNSNAEMINPVSALRAPRATNADPYLCPILILLPPLLPMPMMAPPTTAPRLFSEQPHEIEPANSHRKRSTWPPPAPPGLRCAQLPESRARQQFPTVPERSVTPIPSQTRASCLSATAPQEGIQGYRTFDATGIRGKSHRRARLGPRQQLQRYCVTERATTF